MTERDDAAGPPMEPGSRSGEGSASVLPHLARQQQSRGSAFPMASVAELQAAVRHASAMVELLQGDYLEAMKRKDAPRAEALALDLAALREMAAAARLKLATALEAESRRS